MKNRFLLFMSGGIVLFFLGFFFFSFIPAAYVNGEGITLRELRSYERAIFHFYQAEYARAFGKNAEEKIAKEIRQKARGKAMQDLIEERLILQSGSALFASAEFAKKVKSEIDDYIASQKKEELEKSIQFLYGISFDEFKSRILMPQLRRDFFIEKLGGEEKFQTWLSLERSRAKIRVFLR